MCQLSLLFCLYQRAGRPVNIAGSPFQVSVFFDNAPGSIRLSPSRLGRSDASASPQRTTDFAKLHGSTPPRHVIHALTNAAQKEEGLPDDPQQLYQLKQELARDKADIERQLAALTQLSESLRRQYNTQLSPYASPTAGSPSNKHPWEGPASASTQEYRGMPLKNLSARRGLHSPSSLGVGRQASPAADRREGNRTPGTTPLRNRPVDISALWGSPTSQASPSQFGARAAPAYDPSSNAAGGIASVSPPRASSVAASDTALFSPILQQPQSHGGQASDLAIPDRNAPSAPSSSEGMASSSSSPAFASSAAAADASTTATSTRVSPEAAEVLKASQKKLLTVFYSFTHAKQLMRWPNFIKLWSDYRVTPALISRAQLQHIFMSHAAKAGSGTASSGSAGEAVANGIPFSTFTEALVSIAEVALGGPQYSAIYRSQRMRVQSVISHITVGLSSSKPGRK